MLKNTLHLVRFRKKGFFYVLVKSILFLCFFIPLFFFTLILAGLLYVKKLFDWDFGLLKSDGKKKLGGVAMFILLLPLMIVVYPLLLVIVLCYLIFYTLINIFELKKAYSEIR